MDKYVNRSNGSTFWGIPYALSRLLTYKMSNQSMTSTSEPS